MDKKKISEKAAAKTTISDMVNDAPEKELRQLVIDYAKKHADFRNMLTVHFSDRLSYAGTSTYAQIIRKAAATAKDKYGFIDYRNAARAIQPVYGLLDNAKKAFHKGLFSVTADIAFAVISNVQDMMTSMDDSSGGAGDCIREGFALLFKLCETDISYDLKDHIFREAETEARNKKYELVGFDDDWLNLLINAAYDKQRQLHLLQLFDKKLSGLSKRKNDDSGDSETVQLLEYKISLLQKMGDTTVANALRLDNLHYSTLRLDLIKELLQEKDYATVKRLIDEGIIIAQKKKHPGTVATYKEILLQLSQELNDIPAVRTIAKELFSGGDMKYYRIIKSTYSTNEWPEISEGIIEELQNTDETFQAHSKTLPAIYIEEGYLDRLLDLLQKNPRLGFVDNYSERLSARFPREILAIYKVALIGYAAQNAGRNHYVIIRNVLKKLQALEGGKDMVKQLVDQLSLQYKTRKAMIEELEKLRH
ncbi:hypothetical protein [Deminuibacter soli]|uniref:Uncharacterized protein n=1 Tax=Deminuibacter soli TaxID=2291815 RepID=A0A3E1NE59_9BACT|nr:hypothetical protein [Deminuibacter soli]RFM26255.1 hypothetical protein DXN05_20300 [Deminuibacter soli]